MVGTSLGDIEGINDYCTLKTVSFSGMKKTEADYETGKYRNFTYTIKPIDQGSFFKIQEAPQDLQRNMSKNLRVVKRKGLDIKTEGTAETREKAIEEVKKNIDMVADNIVTMKDTQISMGNDMVNVIYVVTNKYEEKPKVKRNGTSQGGIMGKKDKAAINITNIHDVVVIGIEPKKPVWVEVSTEGGASTSKPIKVDKKKEIIEDQYNITGATITLYDYEPSEGFLDGLLKMIGLK